MTIFDEILVAMGYALIMLGITAIAAVFAFLIMKWGTVGFYRGKEAFRRRNKVNRVQNDCLRCGGNIVSDWQVTGIVPASRKIELKRSRNNEQKEEKREKKKS